MNDKKTDKKENNDKMQRIQKIIASAGICSRRKAEELIAEGKVLVNGKKAAIGQNADPDKDKITVNGKHVKPSEKIYYILNKPKEIMVTKDDPKKRQTIFDLVNVKGIGQYIISVGRLDFMSEGLLLLTNDGDFANRITHPKFNIEKTYYVRVSPYFKDQDIKKIRQGIMIDSKKTSTAKVKKLSPGEIELTIHEGRNRIIRKIMEHLNYKIFQLKRMKIGFLSLGDIKPGQIKKLKQSEIEQFYK